MTVIFLRSSRAIGTLKFGVNHHLGISVSQYTETNLKKVLKSFQVHYNSHYQL